MYLSGRNALYLISLNMANLNVREMHKKWKLRVILQLSMLSLSFLRNGLRCTQIAMTRHLTADRCFSHCIELITEKPRPPCKLDMQKS